MKIIDAIYIGGLIVVGYLIYQKVKEQKPTEKK